MTSFHPRTVEANSEVDDAGFIDRGFKVLVDSPHDLGRVTQHIVDDLHVDSGDLLGVGGVRLVVHHRCVKVATQLPQATIPDTHVHGCRDDRSRDNERFIGCVAATDTVRRMRLVADFLVCSIEETMPRPVSATRTVREQLPQSVHARPFTRAGNMQQRTSSVDSTSLLPSSGRRVTPISSKSLAYPNFHSVADFQREVDGS